MDSRDLNEVRAALRERAEADRILGATSWPISRAVLARPARPAAETGARTPEPPTRSGAPVPQPTAPLSAPPPPGAPAKPSGPAPLSVNDHIASIRSRQIDLSPPEAQERFAALEVIDVNQVRGCRKCGLCSTRTKTVFGHGSPTARIVFVGEAPGFDEDRTGLPFVGRAGELLTRMIEAGMGLRREDVFICNVLKCRPPENRTPAPDEVAACSPYLFEQLRIIRPEIIVALGAPAAQTLLSTREPIGKLRGRFHDFYLSGAPLGDEPPVPLMATFHPSYLLRSPWEKPKAWEDLKMVLKRLELGGPGE